jgi:DNA-directed RNA polymerase subunit RPC12/RpoP
VEMDVYNCEECTRAFAVEKGTEVLTCCPSCESELFEFSHEVIATQK